MTFNNNLAHAQVWYAWGQRAQVWFIVELGAAGFTLGVWLAWTMRGLWRRYWLLEIVGAASILPAALLNLRHPRPDAPRGAYSTERTI